MTPKWAPNGSPNWPKSLKKCCGKLPVRVLTHPFQKVSQNKAKLTPWDLKKWAPVQARAQFSVLQGIPKMTKNDPPKWTPGTPFGSLLAPKCDRIASELDSKKTIKKWHQKNHKNVANLDYPFARESTILGHVWHLGSTWPPETEKLTIFVQKLTPGDPKMNKKSVKKQSKSDPTWHWKVIL